MDRWIPQRSSSEHGGEAETWPLVRIGDLVHQVQERVKVDTDGEYKMAGVKWYAAGVFHRETVLGREMSAKHVSPLIPGALIYNRLFAWKESFAVVQPEEAGLFVSNEFPQFIADTSRILPEFLYLFCTIPATTRLVNAASAGSAAVSRNRFKETEFLKLELRLPPLPIQQAIVSHWNAAREKVAQSNTATLHLEAEAKTRFLNALGITSTTTLFQKKCFSLGWNALDRWSLDYLRRAIASPAGNIKKMPWPSLPIGELTSGKNGSTPSTRNEGFWNGDIPWISPKDMKAFRLTESQDTITEDAIRQSTAPLIKGPSVLMVVRSGILQHSVPVALVERDTSINQDIRAFTIKSGVNLTPEFLAVFLQCSTEQLLKLVKSSVTVQSINTAELERFPIPLPPAEFQVALVAEMNEAREKITTARAAAAKLTADTAREVEEMILGHRPAPTLP